MRRTFLLGLACLFLLWPVASRAQSDDEYWGDDAGTVGAQPKADPSAAKAAAVLRVAVPDLSAMLAAKKLTSAADLENIYKALLDTFNEINTRERNVIPSTALARMLTPYQRGELNRCWVDAPCVVGVFKDTGIEMVAPVKLSTDALGNLLLLVRLIDVPQASVLREFLVAEPDADKLAASTRKKLRETLVELKLIAKDETVVAAAEPAGLLDQMSQQQVREESEHQRPIGMTVAKWVTMGLGVAALGAGTGFAVMAVQSEDEAKKAATPKAMATKNDDAELNALIANIAFGAGGALIATSIVLFVLDARADSWADGWVSIAPADPTGGAALRLGGTF